MLIFQQFLDDFDEKYTFSVFSLIIFENVTEM